MSSFIEHFNLGLGIVTNSLLLFLIETCSTSLGSYKKLLTIFAIYDLFLIHVQAIVDVRIFNLETTFSMFSKTFPETKWICPFYCATFVVPFALTNINFFYRFWSIKNPSLLSYFTKCRSCCCFALYPIASFVAWFLIELCFDSDVSGELQTKYLAVSNTRVTLGWNVLAFWDGDVLNLKAIQIASAEAAIMTVNFLLAVYLSLRTLYYIRMSKAFSSNYRSNQLKILQVLIIQTLLPVIFVCIPFTFAVWLPLFRLGNSLGIAEYSITHTSFFPTWDAIVVILLMRDYRRGLVAIFTRRKKKVQVISVISANSFCLLSLTSRRVIPTESFMSTVLYYFTLILHCVIAIASVTFNCLLLYCIFNRTPASFRSYSILLKFQALADMMACISAILTIQRIIPCGWTLVYISYGPCSFISSDICYLLYTMLLATNVASFAAVLVAMGARYWILRFGFISKLRVITTISLGAVAPSLLFVCPVVNLSFSFSIIFVISRGDDAVIRRVLGTLHSDYVTDVTMSLIITGSADIRTPSMLVSAGMIICCPLPLFIVIWIYRSLILRGLYAKTKAMSIQTRALHKQFVSALTFQAVLPIFPLLGVSVSLIGIFGVASDASLELSPILLSEIPALFSPIIVIYHIRYYSDAVRLLFKRARSKSEVRQTIAVKSPTIRSFAHF